MTPFHWAATGRDGAPLATSGPQFPSQAEAEAWLAESWQDLVDDGAAAVTLLDGDAVVYGPMSLDPSD